jgi:hypothetical protein
MPTYDNMWKCEKPNYNMITNYLTYFLLGVKWYICRYASPPEQKRVSSWGKNNIRESAIQVQITEKD